MAKANVEGGAHPFVISPGYIQSLHFVYRSAFHSKSFLWCTDEGEGRGKSARRTAEGRGNEKNETRLGDDETTRT